MPSPAPQKNRGVKSEQIILFRTGGQLFAVSSASVQEVRGVDDLLGMTKALDQREVTKVRYSVKRDDRTMYVVNGYDHFGLTPTSPSLVFFLRNTRAAVLVDGIEKMTTMTCLQSLSAAFCHEERSWYRGLTALDQMVVPVVEPAGFLTPGELARLDTIREIQEGKTSATEENREDLLQ